MDPLRRLEDIFAHFPGIGPRQAKRFVYYVLSKSPSFVGEFSEVLAQARKSVVECKECHRFFASSGTKASNGLCSICADGSRDQGTLIVIARDSDLEAIEKSDSYKGKYFVLGGVVPILDSEPDKRVRLKGLLEYVSSRMPTLKEVIVSLNLTPDGEHTVSIVKEAIQRIDKDKKIKITVLGRGLSTGAELEYTDEETIKNALENRRGV